MTLAPILNFEEESKKETSDQVSSGLGVYMARHRCIPKPVMT